MSSVSNTAVENVNMSFSAKKSEKCGSELEEAVAVLKQKCPVTGHSLYEHICDIVHMALETTTTNHMAYFEECSRLLRERHRFRQGFKGGDGPSSESGDHEYIVRMRNVLKDATGHRDELSSDCVDILEAMELARRGGIALPMEEILITAIAMKRLAAARTYTRLRFWGKVMGCRRDYLVLEAELLELEDLEGPEAAVNRKVRAYLNTLPKEI